MNRHRFTSTYSEDVPVPIVVAVANDLFDWLDAQGITATLDNASKTQPEMLRLMQSDDWSYADLADAYGKHLEELNG